MVKKSPPLPPSPPPKPQEIRAAALKKPPVADNSFPLQADADGDVILVKRRGPPAQIDAFHKEHGGNVTRFKFIPWDAVEIKGKPHAYGRYKNSRLFDAVQFQKIYTTNAIPNDPLFNQQWDLPKIDAPGAWDKATSNNVIVAVIDTGVDYSHPDLVNNLWTGPGGEHGYTALGGVLTNGGRDDHFHGTHVAGTIGAMANNAIGVAGINWRTKIASFKFLSAGGFGSTRDAILCIEKMIDLKQAGQNLRVSNNSWGGTGYDAALEDAFREAENAGILNICAAGNNGFDTDINNFSPASLPLTGIVSVLASDQNDNKASFSNYGVESTDLLAPGVAILNCKLNGDYWLLSGTSMASPHVAGACAMVFALNPALKPDQAKTILLNPTSYDRTSFVLNSTGGGRLNLKKLWNNSLIQNPPPANAPPVITRSPPTNIVVVAAGQTVPISISAVDPEGQTPIYGMRWDTYRLPWFYRWMMGGGEPGAVTNFSGSANTNFFAVTGKSKALDQSVIIRFSASDGAGGGASARTTAVTYRDESKVLDIKSAIRGFRIWDVDNHPWFRLDMDTNYPALNIVQFDLQIYGGDSSGGGVGSPCCHPPNQDIRAPYDGFINGSFSVRAFVMDEHGNAASSPQSQYFVSNATLRPPTVRMTVNTTRGVAPLTVTANMSATLPGSATKLMYLALFLDEGGVTVDIFNPVRQFTLTEPGTYAVEFTASDFSQPLADAVIETFTVLPALPPPGLRLVLERVPPAYNVHVYSDPGMVVDVEHTDFFSGTMPNTWAVLKRITNSTGHAVVPVPIDLSNLKSKFFRAVTP